MCHLGDYDPSIETPKIAKSLPARKRKRTGSSKRSKRKSPAKEKPDVEVIIATVQEEEEECVLVEMNDKKGLDKREGNYTITEDSLSNGGQDCTIVEKKDDEETAINELRGLCDDKESISSTISDSTSYMSISDGRDLCLEKGNLCVEGRDLWAEGCDLLAEEVEDMEVDQKEVIVEEEANNGATIINCITESSPERDCGDGGDGCDSGDEPIDVGVVSSSQDNCVIQSPQEKLDSK